MVKIKHMTNVITAGWACLGVFLGFAPTGAVRANFVMATQTLSANLDGKAKLSVVQSNVSLLQTGGAFATVTGSPSHGPSCSLGVKLL